MDHVTLYALDCGLVRTLSDAPASADLLRGAAERALLRWNANRKLRHPPPCEKPVHLFDAMEYAVRKLGQLPGRRALIVISSGRDSGSTVAWNGLRHQTQSDGVAVFGMSPQDDNSGLGLNSRLSSPASSSSNENPFRSICELSGGLVLLMNPFNPARQLKEILADLRDRYIIEFSRPRNGTPGDHNIVVTLSHDPSAFIRTAGVSIVEQDAAVLADPNTLQRDISDAPELGTRKPLKPQ